MSNEVTADTSFRLSRVSCRPGDDDGAAGIFYTSGQTEHFLFKVSKVFLVKTPGLKEEVLIFF
jgi:hypothetical protein